MAWRIAQTWARHTAAAWKLMLQNGLDTSAPICTRQEQGYPILLIRDKTNEAIKHARILQAFPFMIHGPETHLDAKSLERRLRHSLHSLALLPLKGEVVALTGSHEASLCRRSQTWRALRQVLRSLRLRVGVPNRVVPGLEHARPLAAECAGAAATAAEPGAAAAGRQWKGEGAGRMSAARGLGVQPTVWALGLVLGELHKRRSGQGKGDLSGLALLLLLLGGFDSHGQ